MESSVRERKRERGGERDGEREWERVTSTWIDKQATCKKDYRVRKRYLENFLTQKLYEEIFVVRNLNIFVQGNNNLYVYRQNGGYSLKIRVTYVIIILGYHC